MRQLGLFTSPRHTRRVDGGLLTGESGVNPNGLSYRSMDYRCGEHYLSTVGVTISQKLLILPGVNPLHTLKLQLVIWNVTGNTKYQVSAPSYLRGSSGAVILVDLSRKETIERLPEHIQVFLSVNPKGFIIIASNQSDLTAQENLEKLIQLQDLKQLSETYPTSIKTSSSVD